MCANILRLFFLAQLERHSPDNKNAAVPLRVYATNPPPLKMRPIVNNRPVGDKGVTSLNPTVLIVMTVMYRASMVPKLSIQRYPAVPAASKTASEIIGKRKRRKAR